MSQLLHGCIRIERGLQAAALIGVMVLLAYVGFSHSLQKDAPSAPDGISRRQN